MYIYKLAAVSCRLNIIYNAIHLRSKRKYIVFYFIFSQDTSRVFADLQGDYSPNKTSYDAHYTGCALQSSSQQSATAEPNNKPHPMNVTFLRKNPRFICEPICCVKTSVNSQERHPSWWPEELPEKSSKVPQHSFDSTARSDYRHPPFPYERSLMHSGSLPMHSNPATNGIIPQAVLTKTGCKTPKVVEKISYEHQFNSRLDPSHPTRGRRHGSFIWKVVSDVGKQSRNNSKAVEYAYIEDESADIKTSQFKTENNTSDGQTTELNKSDETQPSSTES